MSWQICGNFNPEVWDTVRENLEKFSEFDLIMAIIDNLWENLSEQGKDKEYIENKSNILKNNLTSFASKDSLIDICIELIEENDTCDNGGFNFWIDKEGYHTVSTENEK